jgi:hypothetical protein
LDDKSRRFHQHFFAGQKWDLSIKNGKKWLFKPQAWGFRQRTQWLKIGDIESEIFYPLDMIHEFVERASNIGKSGDG